jgi:hypothetical protein
MAKLLTHPSDVAHPLTWHYIKNVPTYELGFYYDAIWESLDTGTYYPINPFAMEQSLKRIEKEVFRRGFRAMDPLHTVENVPVPVFEGLMDDDDDDLKRYRPPTGPYAPTRRGPRSKFADIYGADSPRNGRRLGRENSRSRSMERRRSRERRSQSPGYRRGPRDECCPRRGYSPDRGDSSRHPGLDDHEYPRGTGRGYRDPAYSHGTSYAPNPPYEQRPSPSTKTTYDTSYGEKMTSDNDHPGSGYNAKTNYWYDPKYGSGHASSASINSNRHSGSGAGPSNAIEPIPTDPYAVLGVSRHATSSEIEKAHKDLIRTHHPDKHAGKSENSMKRVNEKAAAINEARDLLLDKKAREVYDRTGAKGDQAVKNYEAMQNMYKGNGPPRRFGRRDGGGPSRYY